MKLDTRQLLGVSLIQEDEIEQNHPILSAKIGFPLPDPPETFIVSEATDSALAWAEEIQFILNERTHPSILNNKADTNLHLWAFGNIGTGNFDSVARSLGVDFDSKSVTAGIDFYHNSQTNEYLGIFGSLADIDTDVHFAGVNKDDGDLKQLGLYGSIALPAFFIKSVVSGLWTEHDIIRETDQGITQGDADGSGYTASVEISRESYLHIGSHQATLIPFLSLNATELEVNDYRETGVDAHDVDETTTRHLYSVLGAKLMCALTIGAFEVVPKIVTGWKHEFEDRKSQTDGILIAQPNTATEIQSPDNEPNAWIFDASVHVALTENDLVEAFIGYTTSITDNAGNGSANAGVNVKW